MIAYEPTTYWRQRGRTFAEQELALIEILRGLDFDSVLDVGCGTGRVGSLVRGLRPTASYTGLDISASVLRAAAARLPDGTFHETSLARFRTDRRWGLVIASELLMHVPPDDVDDAVAKLRRLSSRWVVTIDYVGDGPLASHNFAHDYGRLFPGADVTRVGSQAIHLVRT